MRNTRTLFASQLSICVSATAALVLLTAGCGSQQQSTTNTPPKTSEKVAQQPKVELTKTVGDLNVAISPQRADRTRHSITLTSAGKTVLVDHLATKARSTDTVIESLQVVDLDNNSTPEVVVKFTDFGPYCCGQTNIYFATSNGKYKRLQQISGPYEDSPHLADLNGDKTLELDGFDYRFDSKFVAHVCSLEPIQIWSFKGGHLIDVTRKFPKQIQQRSLLLKRELAKAQDQNNPCATTGIVASWVANEYLISKERGDSAWKELEHLAKNGKLDLGYFHGRADYLKKVDSFLHKTGYR